MPTLNPRIINLNHPSILLLCDCGMQVQRSMGQIKYEVLCCTMLQCAAIKMRWRHLASAEPEGGADPNGVNVEGMTPISIALERGHTCVVNILRDSHPSQVLWLFRTVNLVTLSIHAGLILRPLSLTILQEKYTSSIPLIHYLFVCSAAWLILVRWGMVEI